MTEDPIQRLTAALEGRYRIERELGEGGMATVYLADDLRHERKVALKVLKPDLAAVVGADRFLAEIKTTANLQHPNILPLFDSGEAGPYLYYVMPFVEGESLRERLDRERQLPVEDAVNLVTDMAEALDYAHGQGVVHRDIKPANILMQQGRPVIADFGIALAVGAAGGARLTETGLSVGTPHYMSPEQATGDLNVGPRSDTYSLGCVLYELLIGEPPFPGATAQAVLGKIISSQPVSATEQRSSVPPNVDAAIRRCLEKLPADRFSTAGDFARALRDAAYRHGAAAARADSADPAWKAATFALASVLVGLLAVLWWTLSRPPSSEGVTRYVVDVPIERNSPAAFGSHVALSPDGSTIAWVGAADADRPASLHVRYRDRLESLEVPGTDGAFQPFFSSDGTRIAYISEDRRLWVASLQGEPPYVLVDADLVRGGGDWGDDGYIYFTSAGSATQLPGLRRVPETGGAVEVVTAVDTTRQELRHYFPDVLPGSELAVVTIAGGEGQYEASGREVGVVDLETGEVRVLFTGMLGRWSPSGHILVLQPEGALFAASFDPRTREAGPLLPVMGGIQVENQATADLDVSESGTLVYAPGSGGNREHNQLVWVDRSGDVTPVDPDWFGDYREPRISPDGTRLAVTRAEAGEVQIWVKELDEGPEYKVTFEGSGNFGASWLPSGDEVAYVSRNSVGVLSFTRRRVDASAPAEVVMPTADLGGRLRDVTYSPDGAWALWVAGGNVFGRRADGDVVPLLTGSFSETAPALSPDGRWLAFVSPEDGDYAVYVRPFPNTQDGKWRISEGPASGPVWSPRGDELFYMNSFGNLMAAELDLRDAFSVRARQTLFARTPFLSGNRPQYDVHPDGARFVMVRLSSPDVGGRLVVVENFFDEIRARVHD